MIENSKNIYCIEGNWCNHPNSKLSIKPILELLNTASKVKYIYKRCLTKTDFLIYLKEFTYKRYKNYPILYIAFHGLTNRIIIGNEQITLKEISNVLKGKLEGKFVHFGSCSTLNTSDKRISDFILTTKCSFISGYKKDVDFICSTAFELLYLNVLQNHSSPHRVENTIAKEFSSAKDIFNFIICK